MASGTHKNGEQINLVYQAAACLAAAVPVGTVYDEAGTIHSAQTTALTSQMAISANMLSGPAAGRYLGAFTPDAEGRWTVVIQDKDGAGEMSKVYEVCGNDVDSLGTAISAVDSAVALVASPAVIS